MSRINRAITQLEQDQPIFYTGGHAGVELNLAAGKAARDSWADYINIGMEHGVFDVVGLEQFMLGLGSGADVPAVLVELPGTGTSREAMAANTWQVTQILGRGVHGLLLCHAETRGAVEVFVDACRYSFRGGSRGNGSQGTAAAVWGISTDEYMQRADPWPLNPEGELLLGLKIENRRALENVEETISVPGVAFAEWGPGDMAMSFGYTPTSENWKRPELQAARDRVFAACRTNGVRFLEAADSSDIKDKIDEGVRVIAGADAALATQGRAHARAAR